MGNINSVCQNSPSIPAEMKTVLQIVLNGLPSPHSKKAYRKGIQAFLSYWMANEKPIPDKLFLQTYIFEMQEKGIGEASINLHLASIKNFAREAADLKVWPDQVPAAFSRVKKIPVRGSRTGIWLTLEQAQKLINAPDVKTVIGIRDRAILSVLLGCGLRRSEIVSLTVEHIQKRSNVWVLANIVGKRNKLRTVVIPNWAMKALSDYLSSVKISSGRLFRPMLKNGAFGGDMICTRTLYRIVKQSAAKSGIPEIAPHDLRRTYAKLAYKNGAKLDQIQINLGHQSLTTTQKYLGIDLDLYDSPGNYLDIKIS